MEKEPKIKKEDFKIANLTVEEPQMGKNFMISFEAADEVQNRAYNLAIEKVCKDNKLNPFHQVGSHEKFGYQAWEMWAETSKETLEQLLPEIHARANELHEKWKKLGIIE